jgi:hypothetical protein
MDCPICFVAITKDTGVVTTSCGHSYHFSCIVPWYSKEKTCPCCRAAATPTEVMPTVQEEEEEEDEMEFTRAGLDIWLRARGGAGVSTMPESVCSDVAGFTQLELNFLSLGNGGRRVTNSEWNWLLFSHDRNSATTVAPALVADVLNPEE